jgi:SAM-dependent methyltransferase
MSDRISLARIKRVLKRTFGSPRHPAPGSAATKPEDAAASPAKAVGTRLGLLEARAEFLQDEVSQLRSLVRHLAGDRIQEWPIVRATRDSFDFQWRNLPEGEAMPSNPAWKAEVGKTICRYAGLPAEWFAGEKVMDAGCGLGRWTYGFGTLGVGSCVSFDISEGGVARTREIAAPFGPAFTVLRKNVLEDLGLSSDFDLVWCFGVLHHTGDTYRGFQNLVRCVKPGGYLFLMIYGEPRPGHLEDYAYYHEMFSMRKALRNLPFEEKVRRLESAYGKDRLHGYFDAISPDINDLYRWDELESWLRGAGFEDIRCTMPDHPNHFVAARRKAG